MGPKCPPALRLRTMAPRAHLSPQRKHSNAGGAACSSPAASAPPPSAVSAGSASQSGCAPPTAGAAGAAGAPGPSPSPSRRSCNPVPQAGIGARAAHPRRLRYVPAVRGVQSRALVQPIRARPSTGCDRPPRSTVGIPSLSVYCLAARRVAPAKAGYLRQGRTRLARFG